MRFLLSDGQYWAAISITAVLASILGVILTVLFIWVPSVPDISKVSYYVYAALSILFVGGPVVVVFAMDCILNRKVLFKKTGIRDFFFRTDALLFRLEMLVVLVIIVSAIVYVIL